MAKFLLHALWVQHSGLHLWVEQVAGHRIVLPDAVPSGTFPPVVESILERASFRHRLRTTLRTPKGREVALVLPTAAYAPEQAITVLAQLSFLDSPTPAATNAQRAAIAPDLMWIIRLYLGLTRFVRAGRVTLRLAYIDDQWWPQWQLAHGLSERGCVAQMMASAPGILHINNRALDSDVTETLPHWIASAELADLRESTRPYPWHDFSDALLHNQPLRRGGVGLLNRLREWKDSVAAVGLQLVVVVEEPAEPSGPEDYLFGQDAPDLPESAARWPVRLHVRSGVDSPQPVRLGRLDAGSVEVLREARKRLVQLAPLLDAAPPAAPFAPPSPTQGDWDVVLTTPQIVDFVARDVPRLKRAGTTVLLPKAWATQDTKARLVTRSDGGATGPARLGMDQLVGFDWHLSVGDKQLNDDEMAMLISSKSGLVKLRGEWVMADTAALARITDYMRKLGDKSVDEAVTLADLREVALEAAAYEPIAVEGEAWVEALLGYRTAPAPQRVELPETVHATLREYQRRGVDWLVWMSHNNLGAVLADDMGLGKTLQLLAMVAVEKQERAAAGDHAPRPTLVVAPTSVVGNWAREAARFVPGLRCVVHHGPRRLAGEELAAAARDTDLMITSYGILTRDCAQLAEVEWDHVVLDEAQHVKNSATRSAKAARALPARQRIALTGTPVENRLSEMRAILDFCNPGILGSATFFRHHFAAAIEREGDEEMTQRLRRMTAPFIMRRVKSDPAIIDDLPEKTEQVITVAMTAEQAALYSAYVNDVKEKLSQAHGIALKGLVLASLTRIKQICNHPAHFLGDGSPVTDRGRHRSGKVAELMRLLDDAVRDGRRVLIFTQYRAFGDILVPYLSDRMGEDIPFLHGGVAQAARDRMVARFQSPDGPPAMVASLKAGGTGLNLTAASVVVHMDRWWNPAVENQATDRAYRIGQDKDVQVYKMITAGTMEESIQDILDGKTQLAGTVVGEGEGWITELSPEDLARLMSYRSHTEEKF